MITPYAQVTGTLPGNMEITRQMLEEQVAQLKMLSQSQTSISTGIAVQDVLRGIVDEQMRILDADTAIVVLRENTSSVFRVAAVNGYGGRESDMLSVQTSYDENAILFEMNRTHTGMVIDDVLYDGRVQNLGGSTDVERSLLIAPLVCKGTFLGVTAVSRRAPCMYTANNLELFTLFARQVAVTLANAQRYETLQRQHDELLRSQRMHESLLSLVLDGGSLSDIAIALAEQSGLSIEIQGVNGEHLASASLPESLHDTYRLSDNRVCVPVIVQRQHLATLCLSGFSSRGSPCARQALAEQAGMVIALTLMRQQATREAERRLQSELVEHLLTGSVTEGSYLWPFAERLGWKMGQPTHVCLVTFESEPRATERKCDTACTHEEAFIQAACAWLRCSVPDALQAARKNEIVLLLPATATVRATMQKLLDFLIRKLPNASITIGIGEQHGLMLDLHASYESAQQALYLARQLNRQGEVLQVDDFGLFAVLVRACGQRDLEQFAHQTLAPLLTQPDLLKTLRLYFATNGSLATTAQQLYTHRNTVLYRLKHIEDLLNVSLSDGDTRLRLDLALKILEIMRPSIASTTIQATVPTSLTSSTPTKHVRQHRRKGENHVRAPIDQK